MNPLPFAVTRRRRRFLGWSAALLVALAVGLLLRLALHHNVPCGSGMSPLVPSACSGPVLAPTSQES